MSVKARILSVRLLEKARKYPAYAKALGLEAASAENNDPDPEGLTEM